MADKELTYKDVWETLSKVDVSKHTEEKMKLTYLSWSRMWNLLMDNYPQAQYEFVDFEECLTRHYLTELLKLSLGLLLII